MPYVYEYPHPAVTVDVVVFTLAGNALQILLVRRARPPWQGMWALPGGFVEIDESLRRAAWRELREETGVTTGYLEQLGAFGRPDRDPRERIITVAYFSFVPAERLRIEAASDAADARLFAVEALPALAADHERIVTLTLRRVREHGDASLLPFRLLPDEFTMSELQEAYEGLLGQELDKRNFRKKILSRALAEPTGESRRGAAHRPAQLFRRTFR
jgi:8-oxo-dGTP diphosphatase